MESFDGITVSSYLSSSTSYVRFSISYDKQEVNHFISIVMSPFELQEDQSLQASFKLRYNDHLFFDSLYKIYFDRERSLNGKLTALLNPALLEAGFKVLSIEDVLYSERENFCLV